MTLISARLTFKQHRFELVAAAFAAVLVGIVALIVDSRLIAVSFPSDCLDAWLAGDAGLDCTNAVQRFSQINGEEAGKVFAAMAIIPFLVGLLGGVPLVGREFETRTAQTAWALAVSRRRWFGWQLWPVLVVLGFTVAFAAFSASLLQSTRATIDGGSIRDVGLYGIPVVARAFAALGIGLLCGAMVGRTLPAFVIGACVSIALVVGLGAARDGWISAQPATIFDQQTIDDPQFNGLIFEQAWRGPDGQVIRESDVSTVVPAADLADPYAWLASNGYEVVQLGLTGEMARDWQPIENVLLFVGGCALIVGTILVIERRRPT